jgi:diadenylate cyclase
MPHALVNLFERLFSDFYNPLAVICELLLIAVAVNWCAGILQGTRGTRLLRGLLIVLVVAALLLQLIGVQSDWARLDRLAVLLRYFIPGLAFVALVAFQPELRRALIRAGEITWLRRRTPLASMVATLVESAKYLSKNRYGALVAIQREVGLGNWIETGTPINGELSARLLNAIFYPNSALHDLGVVISGNRIVAANCQFPQAESGELDTALGSRHRAAVGLSQESDALVLVVSEETGAISLADRGKLLRFLSLDDLDSELTNRLGGVSGSLAARRLALSRTGTWRLLRRALVVIPLTLVLWLLADQVSQVSADGIQIAIKTSHPTLHVVASRSRFTIAVKGSARAVDELRARAREGPYEIEWRLPANLETGDLRQTTAGVLDALPEIQRLGVAITKAEPAEFSLAVDEVRSVSLPVVLDRGTLVTSDERIEPPQVSVQVRGRDLRRLQGASIRALLPDHVRRLPASEVTTFDAVVSSELDGVRPLRVDPGTVRVTLMVIGEQARQRIDGITVRVVKNPDIEQRYQLIAAEFTAWVNQSIEVQGERGIVASLTAQDVDAWVIVTTDMIGKRDQEITALVDLRLPPGVKLVSPPLEVRFRLIEREEVAP